MGDNNIKSELDRVLEKTFRVSPKVAASLGEALQRNMSDMGLSPGTSYAGGPQTGPSGQGRKAASYKDKLAKLFDGIDLSKCGPLGNEDCAELISRLLEQTFRNFQLTARPPSHVAPPYPSTPIDVFAADVAIPVGVFTPICTFVMPAGLYRGEILSAFQCCESQLAFVDMIWRITVDGQPYAPWNAIMMQLWPNNVSPLAAPIHLQGEQTIQLEAMGIVAPHTATGRLSGWFYLMRANVGGNTAQSTIVD